MSENPDKYTRPRLRSRLKDQLMASDKGGKPGRWSASKSQILVQEYEKAGGGYRGPKDEAARSLEQWTAEKWQTRDAAGRARGEATTRRYLPAEVWDRLTPAQKNEPDRSKQAADREGAHHVECPEAVRKAFVETSGRTRDELYREARELDITGRDKMNKREMINALTEAKSADKDVSKDELYNRARELEIDGRSTMNKAELQNAGGKNDELEG